MEEKKYTVVLADGTEIKNLTRNGDNYISDSFVSPDIFENNCSPIIFKEDEAITETWPFAELVQMQPHGRQYWIVFREITSSELERKKIRADIDYIAMMADVDLEEA